ncbi:MAG: ATP-dependent DNA helicase [Alphaproteobacteria bacterium]|nr:ATP-dependent DNA helicase [Alphaproteobacteria bacterium]
MNRVDRLAKVPAAPALVMAPSYALWLSRDGEVEELAFADAAARAVAAAPFVCHAVATARALASERFAAFDLLELFAFVRPAVFCLPTPRGLAQALHLPAPGDALAAALLLPRLAAALLAELGALSAKSASQARALARTMDKAEWPWAPFVLEQLAGKSKRSSAGFDIWRTLPAWVERTAAPDRNEVAVSAEEARARVRELTAGAEQRPEQEDFSAAVVGAFQPRRGDEQPAIVLAEAGTGTGKTLGYLAAATLWSERNSEPVWISTFTKNLQSQISAELDRILPERARGAVAVRKGRENYLCLLNYEDAVGRLALGGASIGLGLIARWAQASRDGDLVSGDFPGWLRQLVGWPTTTAVVDHAGECVRSACPHYSKCFVERAIRRSRVASIVVVNHALVVAQAVSGHLDGDGPQRIIFDEAHHLFEVADAAFTARLSGRSGARLRRWIRGAARSRARRTGLLARYGETLQGIPGATEALQQAARAARILPRRGFGTETSMTVFEHFLAAVADHVRGRDDPGSFYDIEADKTNPPAALLGHADALKEELGKLTTALAAVVAAIASYLETTADLDRSTAQRLEAIRRTVDRHAATVRTWTAMLGDLARATPPAFLDWFAIERDAGRDRDAGMFRSWVDPTAPFAEAVLKRAAGAVLTSATLRDTAGESEDWAAAEVRTGAHHLAFPAMRSRVPSPFDYASQTRIFVAADVAKGDRLALAHAFRELFLAAGGGALGLFTSIARLRDAQAALVRPLAARGIPLFAQHVDGLDTATLIDMFRAEPDSCLLGTDATRDGIDVPGRALRLVVFERVPWPRQTLLHRARRDHFGGGAYDDRLIRLRLKQAYGRLIRRRTDQGVFVLLDKAFPSRFLTAFPTGVRIERAPLAEIVAATKEFLAPPA